MKKTASILFFIFAFSVTGVAQKVKGEKKTNKLLIELTTYLSLSEDQQKKVEPVLQEYTLYKKIKKKEKKARKKAKIKLSKIEKKSLKVEKSAKKKIRNKKMAEILSKVQQVKYKEFKAQKKEAEKKADEKKKN